MTCRLHHSLGTLLKADEPSYLVTVAHKRKRKSREEIAQSATRLFSDMKFSEKEIKNLYNVSISEYIDRLVEIENQSFGDLDSAFVPDRFGCQFVSKTNLEKVKKRIEHDRRLSSGSSSREWKIVYTEIKGRTLDARRDLYSKCGLKLIEHEGLTREEWLEKVNNFIDFAKEYSFVSRIYLTGSLATDVASTKDADVVMVMDSCPEKCNIQESVSLSSRFGREMMIIGKGSVYYPIDLYCFNKDEFNLLVEGNYRIVQSRKLLFQR